MTLILQSIVLVDQEDPFLEFLKLVKKVHRPTLTQQRKKKRHIGRERQKKSFQENQQKQPENPFRTHRICQPPALMIFKCSGHLKQDKIVPVMMTVFCSFSWYLLRILWGCCPHIPVKQLKRRLGTFRQFNGLNNDSKSRFCMHCHACVAVHKSKWRPFIFVDVS